MKYNRNNINFTYEDYSSTASFEGFFETSADSTTLAGTMLHNPIPFNSEHVENEIYKGHELDFTLEKIMEKFDPALQKLSEL